MNASSLRAVLRLASRDALRHRGRSILILLTLAFPVAGLVGAATLIHALSVPKAAKVSWTLGRADGLVSGTGPEKAAGGIEPTQQRTFLATLPSGSRVLAYREG